MTTLSALVIVMAMGIGYCLNYVGPIRQHHNHYYNCGHKTQLPFKKVDKVDSLATIDDLEDE